jgi:hypothetical protein
MSGAIPPLPNTPSWRGAQLKHRDNFTFYREICSEGVNWILLAQECYQWRALVNAVMNLRVPQKAENFLTS